MQTSFTLAQLADPDIAEADKILRACVHCGFCTATCPTYVLLGDEDDSPRGRIYLIKDMLEKGEPARREVVKHIDRCLSCLSCMTTCPSGVHYMHLVDHARAHIEATYRRPLLDRLIRAALLRVMTEPKLFRLALIGAPHGKAARAAAARSLGLKPVAAMLRLSPLRTLPRGIALAAQRVVSRRRAAARPRRAARGLRRRCAGARNQRRRHARSRLAMVSRWCRRRAKDVADRSPIIWAASRRRMRWRGAISTPGLAKSTATGSTPSSQRRPDAVPP